MMEKILEIPAINGINEFKQWVKNLSTQDIHSWSSKDWLKLFDALEKYVISKEFKSVMLQDYQKQLQEKKITLQDFAEKEKDISNNQVCRNYFTDQCQEQFAKLYQNYRIEPEIYSAIIAKGRAVGKHLAELGDIDCAAIAVEMGARRQMCRDVNNVMLEHNYTLPDYKVFEACLAPVEIEKMPSNGKTTYKGIKICNEEYDSSLCTMVHEGTHYYDQGGPMWSWNLQKEGILPHGVNRDFYELLDRNRFYYCCGTPKLDISGLPDEQQRKFKHNVFNGYKHQPVEKHASLLGTVVEHTYRAETRQYSERNSLEIYKYAKQKLGMIYHLKHNGDSVTFEYRIAPHLNKSDVEKAFEGMPPEMLEAMNIRETRGRIAFDIPENYTAARAIKKFLIPRQREQRINNIYQSIIAEKQKDR